MLSDYGSDDGTFLVRESKKKKNTLVQSMCYEKKHFHFEIEKRGIYYFLDQVKFHVKNKFCIRRKVLSGLIRLE
jgi:hypothetical protein